MAAMKRKYVYFEHARWPGPRPCINPCNSGMNDHRIYIKLLPPAVTSDELKTHFSDFGKIIDVFIPLNPATQKPKVRFLYNCNHALAITSQL
jgi:RNA recognition motif-containing protein